MNREVSNYFYHPQIAMKMIKKIKEEKGKLVITPKLCSIIFILNQHKKIYMISQFWGYPGVYE